MITYSTCSARSSRSPRTASSSSCWASGVRVSRSQAQAIELADGDLSYRALAEQTTAGLTVGQYGQVPQLEYRAGYDAKMAFRAFA